MAIALTEQPTNNGYYSAYLPIKFVATETANNPAYLYFDLLTSAGASISGVPSYKALNVNNTFTFDASSYLQSILDVLTEQGKSATSIEDLTDLYGKFEVEITDRINGLTSLISNEFWAFANIDGLRYLNDQTANDGLSRKEMLYGSELGSQSSNKNFAPKIQGEFDRVVVFNATETLTIETYTDKRPNNSSTILETGTITLTSYINKLISIPLNRTYLQANVAVGAGSLSTYFGFRVRYGSNNNVIYNYYDDYCNDSELMFINKYGVKEVIKFRSYAYEKLDIKSESYLVGGYTHTGNTNFFNTSANNVKINQSIVEDFEVKGQFFNTIHKGELQDFVSSPLQWIVRDSELVPINVLDGSFTMVNKSRGVEFGFKYRLAQTKPSFK